MNILLRISLIFKFILDKNIPLKEKWWIIIPLIYLLSPVDLIPEPILGFGFVDDIIVLGFLLAIVNDRTKKYYGNKTDKTDTTDTTDTNGVNNEKIIENVEYEIKNDEEDK